MSKTSIFDSQLLERIRLLVTQQNLIHAGQTVIVGFSGGPDSLFLLHALCELSSTLHCTVVVAHLDHGWRPDSAHDVDFCRKVAEKLGLPFVTEHAAHIKLTKTSSGSREELGRLQRRAFFASIAQRYENAVVALGHHADDQQETFFIRLLRGSGITGLAGIKPRDGLYIHPLLGCTKAEIVATLEANALSFLVDATNLSDQFLRNRIRMHVIPALRACDARFDESLARTMDHLRAADDFLAAHTDALFRTCICTANGTITLSLQSLLELHPFIQKRVLLHWFITEKITFVPSDALFEEILRFLHNTKSNQHRFYNAWNIHKKKNTLTISRD